MIFGHLYLRLERVNVRNTVTQMDGCTDDLDILQIFTTKYDSLYNSVGLNSEDVMLLLEDINTDAMNLCYDRDNSESHLHYLNVETVSCAISKMKAGQSEGYDGLTSDYLKNGSDLLYSCITLLFNCILCHVYIPTSFCIAMLVPIPKNKLGNLSESSNYRAIALSSLLCKILDTCIIDKQESVFKSHDLLFAYKANHSTVQCVTMIRETVSYYLSYSNQLFMCMLDASKAFDKVNLLLLFRKLRDKGMCPIILRFIVKLYINQCI